jgi:plasmid stabilization system protein ParE
MTRYVLGRFVHADLEDIWDYIAIDDIDAADRWIEKLLDVIEMLSRTPEIGHKRQDLTTLPLMFWSVGAYLVIYRKQARGIEIVAVTQGARHIPSLLSSRIP